MKPKIIEVVDGLVKVKNLLAVDAPQTFLTTAGTAGTAVINVKNLSQFAPSFAVQIGKTGDEQTEVKLLGTAALANTIGTLTANMDFDHPTETPVYGVRWDQVVFQKSTAGTAGTATAIAGGTVTYQPNSEYTAYYDTGFGTAHAYRAILKNSIGTATAPDSTQSDWMTYAGLPFYALGRIRSRVQKKLRGSAFIDDEGIIDDWINEFKDMMSNAVISVNKDYAMGTADVAFGTEGLGTVTTEDFTDVRRFETTYNGSDFYLSSKMDINDFLPDEEFSSTHPYHAWRGDTIFKVLPAGSGGTARITFYRFGTTIVNDTDLLPQPMRPYTASFVNYALAQALRKGEQGGGDTMESKALSGLAQFVGDVAKRDDTGVSYMDVVEPTSAEGGGVLP